LTSPLNDGARTLEQPDQMVELSVVVPVYGCGDCLRALHERLTPSVKAITSSYELIFVDDRSPDDAWPVLQELARNDPRVKACRLSRNFGQHAAITAGLAESQGRWTVVMDCDGQDPPEEIPRLYAKAQEGYDVVFSRRLRRRQALLRRMTGHMYYRVRNVLVKGNMDVNMTNLSILSRKVVDAFLTLRDKNRQYLLIVEWLGYHHTTIDVDQHERHAGRSSYSFPTLVRVAIDGLFFDSTVLLRWIVYAGFAIAAVGGLLGVFIVVFWVTSDPLPGWSSVSGLVLLLGGFIIVATGVAGLYIGKIFDQVKGRPLYIVDSRVVGGVERSVPRALPDTPEPSVEPPAPPPTEREPLSS
jgi:polyisoprenyl-phosphate glycosyltransferase